MLALIKETKNDDDDEEEDHDYAKKGERNKKRLQAAFYALLRRNTRV